MAQFDAAAKALMSQHDVHKMSIAVSREGRLVFARGYLRNSQGHAPTGATTARFASCSKLLTSIAIHRLIELGKFAMTDRMADLIDIDPPPGMTAGNNTWGAVTIEDLLKMRSGLRPGFADLDKKVVDAFSGSLPVTEKRQIASYLRTFDTGTLVLRNKRWEWTTGDDPDIATMPSNPDSRGTDFYRNTDWFLLTVVIEEITGKDYVDAVDDFILRPLGGLKTVQVANSRASEVGETDYEPSDTKLYPSVFSDKQEPVKRGFKERLRRRQSGGRRRCRRMANVLNRLRQDPFRLRLSAQQPDSHC